LNFTSLVKVVHLLTMMGARIFFNFNQIFLDRLYVWLKNVKEVLFTIQYIYSIIFCT
jgi:hypothetical protein